VGYVEIMREVITVAISLAGVLGLIFLLFYGLRLLNKRVSVIGGSRLRILDRANLGRESMILVVSVCGKLMLVGVSNQRVEKISDLDISEEEYTGTAPLHGVPGFSEVFGNFFNRKKGKSNDGEKSSEDCGENDRNA
jgi:flagellar biogenesis protein FliO